MSSTKTINSLQHEMGKLSALLEREDIKIISPLEADRDSLLFDASARRMLIRMVSWLSMLLPLITTMLVLRMTADNLLIEFGNIAAGRLFQFFLVSLSGIFLYAMMWLSGRYILYVTRLKNGKIVITTWHIVYGASTRIIAGPEYTQYAVYHEGRSILPFAPVVNAPYVTVFIGGKKMILDAQGDFPHGEDALMEVLKAYG